MMNEAVTHTLAADRSIKVAVWTSVGQPRVLEALAPARNVVVTAASTATGFCDALLEAEVAVTVGNGETYSTQIANCIRDSPTLRWVHLMSAGHEGLTQHGFPAQCLLTGPGEGVSAAVAEHALALLWALARGLPRAQRQQLQQHWDRGFAAETLTLSGKTLLIAGFGNLGRKIATLARAIGMYVIAVSYSGRASDGAHEVHATHCLRELLPRAHAVIDALPLNPSTAGLFDQQAFACCRPGTLFVNVGRGGTVDHAALLHALAARTLQAAALDVVEHEPLAAADPLWLEPRVLLTPHIGGAGDRQAIERMAERFAANLHRYLRGEPLLDVLPRP